MIFKSTTKIHFQTLFLRYGWDLPLSIPHPLLTIGDAGRLVFFNISHSSVYSET